MNVDSVIQPSCFDNEWRGRQPGILVCDVCYCPERGDTSGLMSLMARYTIVQSYNTGPQKDVYIIHELTLLSRNP